MFPRLPVLASKRLARSVGVPVHERAIGIILPRSDMQRVERREAKVVRAVEQIRALLAHTLQDICDLVDHCIRHYMLGVFRLFNAVKGKW